MKHINILRSDQYQGTQFASKTLEVRATGRFYTPEVIGRRLAREVVLRLKAARKQTVRLCDPFAGDGRLIRWVLEEAATANYHPAWEVEVWDIDDAALKLAVKDIRGASSGSPNRVGVLRRIGDSFARSARSCRGFDAVISNPPWDLLKPDRREMSLLQSRDRERYVQQMRDYDARLALWLPNSQPARKFAGWGTNLSRVGIEACVNMLRPKGVLGLVTPASLFADHSSLPLREWLEREINITLVAAFPAEAKLFVGVDQSVTTFVATREPQHSAPIVTSYDLATRTLEQRALRRDVGAHYSELAVAIAAPSHVAAVLERTRSQPRWRDLELSGLWCGRELDETHSRRYLNTTSGTPFLKGRMIGRYELKPHERQFINKQLSKLPTSVRSERLIWRDVSRANQKRRAQATIISPGWVTGNSLGVAYFLRDDRRRLRALLAVFNSLVFEAQVRCRLFTSHLSLSALRDVAIPDIGSPGIAEALSQAASSCLNARDDGVEAEVAVARAYGLRRDEFAAVLDLFPKFSLAEKERLIARGRWQ